MHRDLEPLFDLTGRVAVVTGGSRGLGRAIALGFAKAGASVVVASRKVEACEAVAVEVTALGGQALAHPVRMQEAGDVAVLVDATMARFGGVDIVVNDAGTVLDRTIDALEPDAFAGAFSTNLLGPLLLVQAAKEHLTKGGHGAVINIVSIAASAGSPGRISTRPSRPRSSRPPAPWRATSAHMASGSTRSRRGRSGPTW